MQTITHRELKNMNGQEKKDFVLINVLPREYFKKQHIRTSINIPVDSDNFTDQVEGVAGDKQRDIVVYCADFECDASTKAAEKLENAGFTHIFDYEGGIKDWYNQKNA